MEVRSSQPNTMPNKPFKTIKKARTEISIQKHKEEQNERDKTMHKQKQMAEKKGRSQSSSLLLLLCFVSMIIRDYRNRLATNKKASC